MTTTTTIYSGVVNAPISTMLHQVAEVAAAAVVDKGVGALPPPTRTSFPLRSKRERVLNVVSGDVNIHPHPRRTIM